MKLKVKFLKTFRNRTYREIIYNYNKHSTNTLVNFAFILDKLPVDVIVSVLSSNGVTVFDVSRLPFCPFSSSRMKQTFLKTQKQKRNIWIWRWWTLNYYLLKFGSKPKSKHQVQYWLVEYKYYIITIYHLPMTPQPRCGRICKFFLHVPQ